MKFASFEYRSSCYCGVVGDEWAQVLAPLDKKNLHHVNAIIAALHSATDVPASTMSIPLNEVRLLAPVPAPGKIICVGRNYSDHASEMGASVGELPVIFNKLPSTIIGPADPVRLPAISKNVDFEAELVAVIGSPARHIAQEDADECVFGFCCGNDITARDWQKNGPGGQWLLGKSFDTFAPLGPWIVSSDEVDARSLDVRLRLNGETMQQANTSQFIFSVAAVIAHVSQFCTLLPGDLIFTGTPGGVGAGRQPPLWLKPGDRLTVEITGIGLLENPVESDR